MSNYLPESMYKLDSNITRQNLKEGDIVTCKVISFKSSKEALIVSLGNFTGIIPIENATIYPHYIPDGRLHGSVYYLIGKHIRARVISIEDNEVILSRKELMRETMEYFISENPSQFTACITGFSKLSAFVDIGTGINGRISFKEFALTYFDNIRDVGLNIGDIIPVKNLGYDATIESFNLSRVALFSNVKEQYSVGDIVEAKVFTPLNDGIGYYCLLDDSFAAIVDSRLELFYGDKIIAKIKGFSSVGPRLCFLNFEE